MPNHPNTEKIAKIKTKLSHVLWYGAMAFIIFICLVGLFAPYIAPQDPQTIDLAMKLQGPSAQHWLGTDHMGRDVASRLIYGTRISLLLAIVISCLTVAVGAPIGLIIGWYGGKTEAVVSFIINVLLAFPTFLLSMALAGIFGQGMENLIIALTAVEWINYARILRNMVKAIKAKEYIVNAKLMGAGNLYIIWKHILPFVYKPLLIIILLNMGNLILMISGFSFLGIGVQPNVPEWGMMLNDARPYFRSMPELILYPGMAIFLTVVCFNIIGEHVSKRAGVKR